MPVFLKVDPNSINPQGIIVPDATEETVGVVKLGDLPSGGVTKLTAGAGIVLTPDPITGEGIIAATPVAPGVFPALVPDTSIVDPVDYANQLVFDITRGQLAFSFSGEWLYIPTEAP